MKEEQESNVSPKETLDNAGGNIHPVHFTLA